MKTKLVLTALFTLALGQSAFAAFSPDFVCDSRDGGIAFSHPYSSQSAKAWIIANGAPVAELQVVKFVSTGVGSYEMDALKDGDFMTKISVKNFKMTFRVQNEGGFIALMKNVQCLPTHR